MSGHGDFPGLTLRSGYFSDRASFLALRDLLSDTFDIDIGQLDRLGGPDLEAMPMGYFNEAGRCVANLSGFSMPLMVDGRLVRAAGFQSGAVRPEYRGRGLYRDLMQRVFAWQVEAGFEAGILLTDKPALYQRYGFQIVDQHCFSGPVPAPVEVAPARSLSIIENADVALMQEILARRSPVSDTFSVVGEQRHFLLNACFDPDIRLSLMPDADAIIAWKLVDGRLHLLDIAATNLPSLAAITSALGGAFAGVDAFITPDKLDWTGTPTPYCGSCALMMRGVTPARPGALSPMADF